PDAQAFERYLAAHPGAIDLWIGGHTHTHPDDTTGGRSHVESKWGVTFINCCSLSRYHAHRTTTPISRLLTLEAGKSEVDIACYLHTSDYASQGWYPPAARRAPLRHPVVLPRASGNAHEADARPERE